MNNCSEFVLDDVMAVTAIPVTDITAASIGSPANSLEPVINRAGFNPPLANAITIGLQAALPGGELIPIVRMTGKAKDDEDDSVAGRLHTVTVTCEVDDRDGGVWAPLLTLERRPSHAGVRVRVQRYLCVLRQPRRGQDSRDVPHRGPDGDTATCVAPRSCSSCRISVWRSLWQRR